MWFQTFEKKGNIHKGIIQNGKSLELIIVMIIQNK